MVNGLRKLGGSCNVSSIAASDKRETTKQKPTHPRKKKEKRKQKKEKKEDEANFAAAFVITRRGCNLGGLHWQCTIGRMIYKNEEGIASKRGLSF